MQGGPRRVDPVYPLGSRPNCPRSTSSKSLRRRRNGCRRARRRSPATSPMQTRPAIAPSTSSRFQPFSTLPPIEMASTNPAHLSSPQSQADALRQIEVETAEQTLSGNTVNLEQQMINLGEVNRDYTMSANIRRAFHQLLLSALK